MAHEFPPVAGQAGVLSAFEPGSHGRRPNAVALAEAERWLGRSVPVVIPTETVYGLAARALDRAGVEAIFAVKGRPLDNPLIAHVTRRSHWAELGARLTPLGERLASSFWPGPLTLVLDTVAALPWVTAGLDSIALRHPAHVFAAALIERVGPLAAPSANLSGRPSPTRAEHAVVDLGNRVPLVIDGGALEHGLESTVIDARGDSPVLLRPGAITAEAIEACTGRSVAIAGSGSVPRAPGMKYRHYSPRAELWLYPSSPARLRSDARALRAAGRRVGAIGSTPLDVDHFIGTGGDTQEIGRHLFAWLRMMDELGMEQVLVEGVRPSGIGRAVMDRLERAAARIIDTELPVEAERGST